MIEFAKQPQPINRCMQAIDNTFWLYVEGVKNFSVNRVVNKYLEVDSVLFWRLSVDSSSTLTKGIMLLSIPPISSIQLSTLGASAMIATSGENKNGCSITPAFFLNYLNTQLIQPKSHASCPCLHVQDCGNDT